MDIDAIIDAAVTTAPEQVATQAAPIENAPEAPQTQETPEDKSLEFKPDSELTPEQLAKRESNRLSHLKSRSAKQARELRELREFKSQQLQQQQQTPAPAKSTNGQPQKPNEADYNSFMEFLEAKDDYFEKLSDWKVEQKLSALTPKQQPSIDHARAQRDLEIQQDTAKFEERVPEYKNLVKANMEFFQNMPADLSKSLESALQRIPSPALALHTLMKEGTLYDLEDMSPVEIGIAISSAHEKGKALMGSVSTVTNAPAPLAPARGNASGVKSTRSMSFDELKKEYGLN